ncbi:GNAT superfamily N-acetyltransferase [Roseobacter sp. N2S]|nr:GNAT superfamily N-acetyltransferase [Roseobacter sp. N2S]
MNLPITGLPNGYEGLLIIAPSGSEPYYCLPMNEYINPTSVHNGDKNPSIWCFVWPVDSVHNCCGWFIFTHYSDKIVPDNVDVHEDHRRQGIASSVYLFVKKNIGTKLVPAEDQTDAARKLWKKLAPDARYL